MSNLTFTPIGAGSQIGANCYQIAQDGHSILIDCGVHPKTDGPESLPQFDLLKKAPAAVIVSHGHIDHCGSLPYFLKRFPESLCTVTEPTLSIIDRMLHNSVSVMTKLSLERGIQGYPLYTHQDVEYAISRTQPMALDVAFEPSPRSPFTAQFQHAGHVLGSAGIILRANGHTIYYTGDICLQDQELMQGLEPIDPSIKIDTLIIESTRGAHVDDYPKTYEGEIMRFADATRSVLAGGGCVLVPAFALGRTQELCNIIVRLQENGDLPGVPIYASGLGRAVYEVYNKFPEYLRRGARLTPLNQFRRIGDVWNPNIRRQLLSDPCIIVATSGMMLENTPSAMLSIDMVRDKRHGIFFVGYLDPDTLGYKLAHGVPGEKHAFMLGGEHITVVLENIQRFHFSAHAPREDLIGVVERIKPKNLIFVHGDDEAVDWMKANCRGDYRKFAPKIGETVPLEG